MKNRTLAMYLAIFLLFIFNSAPSAQADMGQIHAYDIQINEEAQKAIILHNFEEEVLILGTDLKAEKKTGIIRFIPFPSEPEVSLAPDKAFDEVARIIKDHKIMFYWMSKGSGVSGKAVELRFHQKLGSHDMTTIKVNDVSQFRTWVNEFFKQKGQPQKDSYPDIEQVVQDYVQRGIVYFVVDYVEISPETRMIEPVAYRFKSKELYYPLKTSNTFGGEGDIELYLITPRSLCSPIGWTPGGCPGKIDGKSSGSAKLNKDELVGIYPGAPAFFGDKTIYFQMFVYHGEYRFDYDIFADVTKGVDREVGSVSPTGNSLINLEDLILEKETKKP